MEIPTKASYTREDYEELPEGAPYQLIAGKLIMSPGPTPYHQIISTKLLKALLIYIEEHSLGILFHAPTDVYFTDTNIVQPDLFFIKSDRKHIIGEQYINGSPDLLIEILSPSTAYYDLKKKKELYELHKVPEYWIVDPGDKTVDVYFLDGDTYKHPVRFSEEERVPAKHIEGFSMPVKDIFQ